MPGRLRSVRGQSTLEYVALLVLVATVMIAAGAAIGSGGAGGVIDAIRSLVGIDASERSRDPVPPVVRAAVASSLRPGPLGAEVVDARALLVRYLGPDAAQDELESQIRADLPGWLAEARGDVQIHLAGGEPSRIHIVTADDERATILDLRRREQRGQVVAAAVEVAVSGARVVPLIAKRLSGPAGIALDLAALGIAAWVAPEVTGLPAGGRAGDIIICTEADARTLRRRDPQFPFQRRHVAVVVRHGTVVMAVHRQDPLDVCI